MNYSVKKFIKENCNDSYKLEDLHDIAKQVSIDSDNRYTNTSALKILCRYASIKKDAIVFDGECRDSDQTFNDLQTKFNNKLNSKSNTNQNNENDISTNMDIITKSFPKLSTTSSTKPSTISSTKPSTTSSTKPSTTSSTRPLTKSTGSGFGKLGAFKSIVTKDFDDDDSGNNGGNNGGNNDSNNWSSKQNRDQKSIPISLPTKTNNSNDSSSTIKSSSFPSSKSKSESVIVKKGGFGKLGSFSKMIDQKESDDIDDDNFTKNTSRTQYNNQYNNQYNSKYNSQNKSASSFGSVLVPGFGPGLGSKSSTSNENHHGYNYPTEKKYNGPIRRDKKYGPYGTESFHDHYKNIADDEITQDVKPRIEMFRKLAARKYPAQRSEEWFRLRDELISASDGGTVVGMNPHEPDFGIVIKKVHGKPFDTSIDCYHGKKYEQVATMSYEYRMNVKVKEFGLCRSNTYTFLGASPDGIVSEFKLKTRDGRTWEEIFAEVEQIEKPEDKQKYMEKFGYKTRFVGRMLEIKCPMRRKIIMDENAPEVYGPHGEKITNLAKDVKRGVCPAYYWVQVQLQLQCCELDECDFWQCEITEYPCKEAFLEDTNLEHPWLSRSTGHEKGAVIQLMPVEQLQNNTMNYNSRIYNFAEFIYQPRVDMTPLEVDQWINHTLNNLRFTHKGKVLERILYWKIVATRSTTIKRDDVWFEENVDRYRQMWDYITYFRENKDKSDLLKRYINIFPLDSHGKIKEPTKNKGVIMNTIEQICAESSKSKKEYEKIIEDIETKIMASGVDDPKEYDVNDDIEHIVKSIDAKMFDKLEEKERDKKKKNFSEFIKRLKADVEKYICDEGFDEIDITNVTKINSKAKSDKTKHKTETKAKIEKIKTKTEKIKAKTDKIKTKTDKIKTNSDETKTNKTRTKSTTSKSNPTKVVRRTKIQ
jgi:putative phage-type endonuclease